MIEVDVGADSVGVLESIKPDVICTELDVKLSAKPEANLPFSTHFEFIGAAFDMSDPRHITRRPADHVLAGVEKDFTWINEHRGHLFDRNQLQMAVGRFTFCCRFTTRGRSRLNSAYVALAGARFLHSRDYLAMVLAEMPDNVALFVAYVQCGRWTPITKSEEFVFLGAQCNSSDASAFLTCGWGVRAFGRIVSGGDWASTTWALIADGRLSIKPLELLAAAAAATVVLLDKCGFALG